MLVTCLCWFLASPSFGLADGGYMFPETFYMTFLSQKIDLLMTTAVGNSDYTYFFLLAVAHILHIVITNVFFFFLFFYSF
jgi:hypothetical protein